MADSYSRVEGQPRWPGTADIPPNAVGLLPKIGDGYQARVIKRDNRVAGQPRWPGMITIVLNAVGLLPIIGDGYPARATKPGQPRWPEVTKGGPLPNLPKFDIPGQAHFATTKTNRFIPLFLTHDICKILLNNIAFYRTKHDFRLLGYVIMPDHIHLLITPNEEVPIQKILQDIKRYSAKQIIERLLENPTSWGELGGLIIPPERMELCNRAEIKRYLQNAHVTRLKDFQVVKPRTKGQEHQIWQESFYDFNIYSDVKLNEKLNYIHKNPLAWNLVEDPGDYYYSSYRNYYDDSEGDLPIPIDYL